MELDSVPCVTNKYIDKYLMSPLRNHQGQTTWSKCSRDVAKNFWHKKECLRDNTRPKRLGDALDHSRYHDLPGRIWIAKAQCEIYFHDKDANVVSLLDICKTLQCETPHKNGHYITGPALEGTYCAPGKECRGGECVPVIELPYIFKHCQKDKWSEWKEDTCQSSCLEKSKGIKVKRRSCKHRNRRTANCKGPYYDVILCNDTLLCTKKRKTIDSFIAIKCEQFNRKLFISSMLFKFTLEPAIDSNQGWQAVHDFEKPWIACTVHCQRENSTTFVARLELLSINDNSYFPDGTWCHEKDGQNYYCQRHYCLPESYS
nr:PREDICTED: A disintegrin and metalloproteinase with thrombospondin motifs 18-like [Linepithema humile]